MSTILIKQRVSMTRITYEPCNEAINEGVANKYANKGADT
jgi:hypothetical protein